jgi:hypothetical protein
MKNETTMTKKLTPAQAYAAQVRADRRAAVRDDRRDPSIIADNARLDAMFATTKVAQPKVAKAKVKAAPRKFAPWSTAEYSSIVDTYLRLSTGGVVNKDEVVEAHAVSYPRRSEGAVSYAVSQLRGLDIAHSSEISLTSAEGLVIAAYEAAPERFPAGAELVEARLGAALSGLL